MTDHGSVFTRRKFVQRLACGTISALFAPQVLSAAGDGRELVFDVKNEFGSAPVENIAALLKSVAQELWQHCPNTRFLGQGFTIYRNKDYPITHFKHENDRIKIGLNTENLFWSQYAYQFAHEFCHALIDHTHENQRKWHLTGHANQWLDETLCETASLFALRAMSTTWKTNPPYPNWKSYAPKLAEYIQNRADEPQHTKPADVSFSEWFRQELPSLREKPTQRAKNTIIAFQLLGLFEAEPAGWESVTTLKLADRDLQKPLQTHLEEWKSNTRKELRPFVAKVGRLLT